MGAGEADAVMDTGPLGNVGVVAFDMQVVHISCERFVLDRHHLAPHCCSVLGSVDVFAAFGDLYLVAVPAGVVWAVLEASLRSEHTADHTDRKSVV